MIVTTNIRLPQEQWKALKIMAVHAGTSVSALVRQAIGSLLTSQSFSQKPMGPKPRSPRLRGRRDPFFEVIGIGAGGPSDDSERHDLYL